MSTLNHQALYGALAKRYDVGFSQDVTDQVQKLDHRDIQLLDIKELNDLLADYRSRIRSMVSACRAECQNSTVRQTYASFERIFLRRQLADLWALYRTASADRHELTETYLEQLSRNSSKTCSFKRLQTNQS